MKILLRVVVGAPNLVISRRCFAESTTQSCTKTRAVCAALSFFPFSTNQVVGCAKMHATRASRSFFLFQPIALSLLIVLKCVPHVLQIIFPLSSNHTVDRAKTRAARAARLFFLFQPITLLIVLKRVPHVLHDYFSSFNQSHC